jgi:hypothetical protein
MNVPGRNRFIRDSRIRGLTRDCEVDVLHYLLLARCWDAKDPLSGGVSISDRQKLVSVLARVPFGFDGFEGMNETTEKAPRGLPFSLGSVGSQA